MRGVTPALAVVAALHRQAAAMPLEKRYTASPPAVFDGCNYQVPGIGAFNYNFAVDYTQTSSLPSDLQISTYTVGAGYQPYSRQFTTSNVVFNQGDSMSLLVPGNQSSSPIYCGQVTTVYDDILYGSVRTIAMASTSAGTVHGFFFYANDNQEIDIEILTSNTSLVHWTNQPTSNGVSETTATSPAPADDTYAYHEYRVDWTANATYFYIDGTLMQTLTTNVASQPGFWIWNNWSNGGSFTSGPPATLSNLRIQSINAYFNRTSISNSTCTPTTTLASSTATSTTLVPSSSTTTTTPPITTTTTTTTPLKPTTTTTTTTTKPATTTPKTTTTTLKTTTTTTKTTAKTTTTTKPATTTRH